MRTAVFDLGGVVIVWDPVPAVAAAVGRQRAERFVRGGAFDFADWNHLQDAGRSWQEAETVAMASHPHLAQEITAYRPNFPLSLLGPVPGTTQVLVRLKDAGVRLVALTNWSAETFHHAPAAYPGIFALFDDVVVSGAEGVAKPDPRIFDILAVRLGSTLQDVFFTDDSPVNVAAARTAGMDAELFTDAARLLEQLRRRDLLT